MVVWGWTEGEEGDITRKQGPFCFLCSSCSGRLAQVDVHDNGRGRRQQARFTNPFRISACVRPGNILLPKASHIAELGFMGGGVGGTDFTLVWRTAKSCNNQCGHRQEHYCYLPPGLLEGQTK